MAYLKKIETVKITYDQKKITLKGDNIHLEVDMSMPSLLQIYSSGYGEGKADFTVKLPDEKPKAKAVEPKKEVSVPVVEANTKNTTNTSGSVPPQAITIPIVEPIVIPVKKEEEKIEIAEKDKEEIEAIIQELPVIEEEVVVEPDKVEEEAGDPPAEEVVKEEEDFLLDKEPEQDAVIIEDSEHFKEPKKTHRPSTQDEGEKYGGFRTKEGYVDRN